MNQAISKVKHLEFLKKSLFIRLFERKLLDLYAEGRISGTTHTCIGQELTPVVIGSCLIENDFVFSNHRGHGHFISATNKAKELLYEILGDSRGICHGQGGSQHLYTDNFLANGILAGNSGFSIGVALANKLSNKKNVVVYFMGDGSICEGIFYEALNFSSLFQIPILFVIENNQIAQSTDQASFLSGDISKRFSAFSIDTLTVDDNKIEQLISGVEKIFASLRVETKPMGLVVNTRRLSAHSKGDDTRSQSMIDDLKKSDFISRFQIDAPLEYEELHKEVHERIENLTTECLIGDGASPELYEIKVFPIKMNDCIGYSSSKIVDQIRSSLHQLLKKSEKTILIGEDISDPYGGAFKATKGLSTEFPDQVITSPISEGLLIGVAGGLSMKGKLPIIEIMFGDFITLCFDQLVNHVSKYVSMYKGIFKESIIIRTPMGGFRGYGATHSQSLEKFLFGISGIRVIAINSILNIEKLYEWAVNIKSPVIIIENKILYSKLSFFSDARNKNIFSSSVFIQGNGLPIFDIRLKTNKEPTASIIAYGDMVDRAAKSIVELYKQKELSVNLVVITSLNEIDYSIILEAISSSTKIFIIEEGTVPWGWGSELIANLSIVENKKFYRHGNMANFIPSNIYLEHQVLPTEDSIYKLLEQKIV